MRVRYIPERFDNPDGKGKTEEQHVHAVFHLVTFIGHSENGLYQTNSEWHHLYKIYDNYYSRSVLINACIGIILSRNILKFGLEKESEVFTIVKVSERAGY